MLFQSIFFFIWCLYRIFRKFEVTQLLKLVLRTDETKFWLINFLWQKLFYMEWQVIWNNVTVQDRTVLMPFFKFDMKQRRIIQIIFWKAQIYHRLRGENNGCMFNICFWRTNTSNQNSSFAVYQFWFSQIRFIKTKKKQIIFQFFDGYSCYFHIILIMWGTI